MKHRNKQLVVANRNYRINHGLDHGKPRGQQVTNPIGMVVRRAFTNPGKPRAKNPRYYPVD